MRFAGSLLLAVCLGGCLVEPPSSGDDVYYPPPDDGWGSGYGGSGGTTGYGCHSDSECGSLTCARDGECLSASSLRTIHVNWTMNDMPASSTSCTHAPDLAVTFISSAQEMFGFAPVPCNAGRYTIDKFPTRYMQVQLTRSGEYSGGSAGFFDATGSVSLDLRY